MRRTSFSPLARLIDRIAWLGGVVSALLIVLMLVVVTVAVCLRYIIGSPLLWGDEFLGFLVVATPMCGAAEALRRGDHINIDLLTARLPGGAGRAAEVWSMLAVLTFAGALGWSAWETVMFSRDFGAYSSGYLEAPLWIPQAPMVLGAVLLGLAAITRIVACLTRGERR